MDIIKAPLPCPFCGATDPFDCTHVIAGDRPFTKGTESDPVIYTFASLTTGE